MKAYLAGKWEEAEKIKGYANELREEGVEITLPWFELHVAPATEDLASSAYEDAIGVMQADVCIFVFENELPYRGAFTELGIALGTGRRIILIGHGGDRNIFTHLDNVERVETWADAKTILQNLNSI